MASPTTESVRRKRRRTLHSKRMSTPFKRNATYADLEALPETLVGEIIDGDLWAFSRPASGHAIVLRELTRGLGPLIDDDGPNGWVILADVEVRFGPHLLVPDVVGWRRTRMPVVPDLTVFELRPDWVCEGMSPSTARMDRGRKREIYAEGGVPHLWFVDPAHHTLEVLTLDGPSYRVTATAGGADRGHYAPFETVELDLARFWRR